MRRSFIRTLTELANEQDNIFLLTGDLGFSVLEPFAEVHSDRFINMGVAEQNMLGVATGLAEAGFVVFVYSITPFAVLRPYEFIRNGPIAHQLPVRIVGTGEGVEYAFNGMSHFGLEDIGVLRIQPDIKIIAPIDNDQACNALRQTWNLPGPIYYRVSRFGVPQSTVNGNFKLGHFDIICEGSDLAFVSLGPITQYAVQAAEMIADTGVSCAVAAVSSLPVERDRLANFIARYRNIVTVEDHYVDGGIGTIVSEVAAGNGLGCTVTRCGLPSVVGKPLGSYAFLREQYQLSAEGLVSIAGKLLSGEMVNIRHE